MAVQVIAEVWAHSKASGTRLLILLAMADRARKEDGVCWPGREAIALQARVGVRNVEIHQRALCAMGELAVLKKGGERPGDTTVYQITVGSYKGVSAFALRGDYKANPKSERGFAHTRKAKGETDFAPTSEPGFAHMGESMGESMGENRDRKRANSRSLEPNALDPLDPIEPAGGVSPQQPTEPSPDSLVARDGLLAGTPLSADPSTGRLRIAR